MQKTYSYKTRFLGKLCKHFLDFFLPKKIGFSFVRFWKTLQYPPFLIFLLTIHIYIVITDFNKIKCPNQNVDKNLDKQQFRPRDAGTLKSQKILNGGILFENNID